VPGKSSPGGIESFDFLYMPSTDVARDLGFYRDVLGAEVVFAIEAFGTRVAQVRLSNGGPRLLLAGHLEGEAPVVLHRVDDLDTAVRELQRRGATIEAEFGFPHGPAVALHTPGGQHLAFYELTRPEADARLGGRMDFEPIASA
jgi:catechol 2,3-dioxygenase-like lactoylglutathione lyase family enzyme